MTGLNLEGVEKLAFIKEFTQMHSGDVYSPSPDCLTRGQMMSYLLVHDPLKPKQLAKVEKHLEDCYLCTRVIEEVAQTYGTRESRLERIQP